MLYPVHLDVDLKGFKGGVPLNQFNLIVGDNGSGKTSILNALTLALTGQALDLGFRDDARDKSLLKHLLPTDAREASAQVTMSDNTVGVWRMDDAYRITRDALPMPAVECYTLMHTACRRGSDAVIEFFVEHFADAADFAAAPIAVTDPATREALQLAFGATPNADERARLVAAYAAASVQLAAAKKLLKEYDIVEQYAKLDPTLRPAAEERAEQANRVIGVVFIKYREVLRVRREQICARINESFPEDYGFSYTLGDPGIELQFVDHARSGRTAVAACGAEWTLLMFGLAAAYAKGHPAQVNLLVQPDKLLSPTTHTRLQRAAAFFPGCVILQSLFKPRGRPRAGWNVVLLDAAKVDLMEWRSE